MLNHIDAINKPNNEKNKQTNWRNNVFGKKKREREKKKEQNRNSYVLTVLTAGTV